MERQQDLPPPDPHANPVLPDSVKTPASTPRPDSASDSAVAQAATDAQVLKPANQESPATAGGPVRKTRGMSQVNLAGFKGTVSNKALAQLGIQSADTTSTRVTGAEIQQSVRPRVRAGTLLSNEYHIAVGVVMHHQPLSPDKKLAKEIQNKVAAYENSMTKSAPNTSLEQRRDVQKSAAQEALVAIKNYQLANQERYLFGGVRQEDQQYNTQLDNMRKHLEVTYSINISPEIGAKLENLEELSRLKNTLDQAKGAGDLSGIGKHAGAMVKLAREYGNPQIMQRVLEELGDLKGIPDPQGLLIKAFFVEIGNSALTELAFNGDRRSQDLQELIKAQATAEFSSENLVFLDRMLQFLTKLEAAHQRGPLSKKDMDLFFKEMQNIQRTHISAASEAGQVNIDAATQRTPIEQSFARFSAEYASGKMPPEAFYQTASQLYEPARVEVNKIVSTDTVTRLIRNPNLGPRVLPAFFRAISPGR